jgi:glycosyltransferase involved in cell wall biosynthesis
MIAGHARPLANAIAAFAVTRARPLVLHGFGVWGYASVLAQRHLARRDVAVVPILSSYTTYGAESRSLVRAAGWYSPATRLRFAGRHAWARLGVEPFERRAYRGAHLILYNYDSVRRLITARFGPDLDCRKVPYASEGAFIWERDAAAAPPPLEGRPAVGPSAPPLVATLARQEPKKGGVVLLRALARLREQGVPFRACLAGEGPRLPEHRRLAERLGLGDHVVLPGLVDDAFALLRRADVFVLASLAEQSGSLALLEALQTGRAIVASGVDGIVEDVVDGDSALLVPPGDEAALARALARLLTDGALRARLGRRARQTFEARFSAEVFADSLGKVYDEMAASRGGSGPVAKHSRRRAPSAQVERPPGAP